MSFKKGDRIVVKWRKNTYRPATFVKYDNLFDIIAYIQFSSEKRLRAVMIRDIILEEIYLSPLYEIMGEEDETN